MKGGEIKKRQRRFHLARQTFRRDSRPIGLIHPAAWRPFVFRLVNLSTKNSLPLHCVLFHGSTTIGKKKKIAKNLCYSKALHSRVVREKTQSARHQKNLRVSPLKTSFYSKKRTSYEGKKCWWFPYIHRNADNNTRNRLSVFSLAEGKKKIRTFYRRVLSFLTNNVAASFLQNAREPKKKCLVSTRFLGRWRIARLAPTG